MDSEHARLRHQQRTESEQTTLADSEQKKREFATVDDLLRFDSEQNPIPPEVGKRLGESIAAEPKPERSWFKKLFG